LGLASDGIAVMTQHNPRSRPVVRHHYALGLLLGFCVCVVHLAGCTAPFRHRSFADVPPPDQSSSGNWQPPYATLPVAELQEDQVRIRNIRNFHYFREDVFVPQYYDKTIPLRDVKSVDFIVVPFKEAPSLAHTMLSFGFADGEYLGVSVEARMRERQKYSPIDGVLGQYELMYVIADERDVIQLRTEHRDVEVRVYRTKISPEEARALFVDVLQRANKLAREPELYHTLTNNCTTNLVDHVNRLRPGQVPYSIGVLLPGHSDRLAYDLGLLDTELSFSELRRASRVNELAQRHKGHPSFSTLIRR
jgi:hypothetical protein